MGSRPTPEDIATYNAWARRNNEDAWGVRRNLNLEGPKQQILEELRALADSRNIRDARKLYQAPPPRSAGHFASLRPGQDIQADLIDFSKNTKLKGQPERYALVVADVFTRKLGIEPLKSKNAASVGEAMQRELKEMGVERPGT